MDDRGPLDLEKEIEELIADCNKCDNQGELND